MKPIDVPLSQVQNIHDGALLLVDKPLTWTSFDVVNKIRYYLKKELRTGSIKVGHAGTLDPLATGLLIVCIGKYTKRIEEIQKQQKEYTGSFIFGATTPSYDLETEIDQSFSTEKLNESAVLSAVDKLIGEIEQVPPSYSAVKQDGVRAYKRARQNKEVKLKSRVITIDAFEVSTSELPDAEFRVVCSTGTYIRSLIHDLGKSLNNGAHLTSLRRTRIGQYRLKNAWELEALLN